MPHRPLAGLQAAVLSELRHLAGIAATPHRLERRAPKLSGWSVGEQIEHLAVVDSQVLALFGRLLEAPENESARRPNLAGRLVLACGWIPRGVGKAPAASRPEGRDPRALQALLGEVEQGFAALGLRLPELARCRARARHPRLGWLDGREWLRFVELHHRHHLRIVRAIERAAG